MITMTGNVVDRIVPRVEISSFQCNRNGNTAFRITRRSEGTKNMKKRVLLIIETSRAYGRNLIEGISRFALECNDWHIHFEDRGLLEEPSGWLRRWQGDGILARTALPSLARLLKRKKCPIVELHGFGKYGENTTLYSEVQICDTSIGKLAADHFWERGFRNTGFYSGGSAWWSRTRTKVFAERLRSRGIRCDIYAGDFESPPTQHPVWENKYEKKLEKWLLSLPKPIGIWAITDSHAVRLIEACQDLGFRVPEDVAVLGTSNDEMTCNLITPALSSINVNSVLIGYEAAKRLAVKMDGRSPKEPVIDIPPLGVVTRQSTDIVAVPDQDVANAVQLIREQAFQGISVDRIVKTLGLSRRTLERNFYKYFGRTPHEEIVRVRIERAKKLLSETNLSVTGIARNTGFTNREYFIRAFGRETGMTPSAFRQGATSSTFHVDTAPEDS